MDKLQNNVPRVRFKNENNKWSIVFLNEIAEINPPSEIPNEFKYVDLESVKSGILLNYRREFKASAPSRAQRLAVNGDIFYQTVRPYQKNNILFSLCNQDYVFSTGYAQLRCNKKINNFFLFSLLETNNFVTEVLNKSTGTSYPSINGSDLSIIRIKIPEIQEQTQIGNFFQKLDKLIELSQTRLEQAKTYKKSMLQKMFPQQGESVPQIRFKGVSGDWEPFRLQQIISQGKSYSLSRDNETTNFTNFKHIHYGDIHKGIASIINNDIELKNIEPSHYTLLEKGDLILADASEDYQNIAKACILNFSPKNNLVAGLHTMVLKPKECDSMYLYYSFMTKSFRYHCYKVGTGMKVFGISYLNLTKWDYYLPSKLEQTKIGFFFQKLDQSIEHQTRKLEHYQQLKKAMLQRMFI